MLHFFYYSGFSLYFIIINRSSTNLGFFLIIISNSPCMNESAHMQKQLLKHRNCLSQPINIWRTNVCQTRNTRNETSTHRHGFNRRISVTLPIRDLIWRPIKDIYKSWIRTNVRYFFAHAYPAWVIRRPRKNQRMCKFIIDSRKYRKCTHMKRCVY